MSDGRRHRHRHRQVSAFAAAAAVLAAAGRLLLADPALVARVSVVNPSEYDITVEVSRGDERWLGITTVDNASTGLAYDVIDQGDQWVFRFRAQGRLGGEVRLSRAELRDAGWTVAVPPTVVDRLRQTGAPPAP